jgi:cytochrome c biogenesis protein
VQDPGKSYALIGAILAIAGLLTSLYGRRRRIWIRQHEDRVEVAALAKNSAPGLAIEVEKFVNFVKGEQ